MTIRQTDIDPAALERHVRLAIASQQHQEDIDELLDAVACGEVDVFQPDTDGYVDVHVGGHRLARLHRTRIERRPARKDTP